MNCPPVVASFLTQRQLSVIAGWQHMGRVPHPNYVDLECCVATVCHQVRSMYWEHLGHFHRAISHLKWHVFTIWSPQTFHMVIYCGLNIELHCFHVYCMSMLTTNSCDNMQKHGYLGCFHAASARKIYLGFVAFAGTVPTCSDSNLAPYVTPLLTHWSYVFVGLAYRFTIFP